MTRIRWCALPFLAGLSFAQNPPDIAYVGHSAPEGAPSLVSVETSPFRVSPLDSLPGASIRSLAAARTPFSPNPILYLIRDGSTSLTILNTRPPTTTLEIPLSCAPRSIGLAQDGPTGYIACQSPNSVAVIDLLLQKLTSTIELPSAASPESLAVSSSMKKIFVTSPADNKVYTVDLETRAVGSFSAPGVDSVAASADGKQVWVSQKSENLIGVFDPALNRLGFSIADPQGIMSAPGPILFRPSGFAAYVAASLPGNRQAVFTVDSLAQRILPLPILLGQNIVSLAISPGGTRLFILEAVKNAPGKLNILDLPPQIYDPHLEVSAPATLLNNATAVTTASLLLPRDPITVHVTVTSSPPGRQLAVDEKPVVAPVEFDWPVGERHRLTAAVAPQIPTSGDTRYAFANWTQGATSSLANEIFISATAEITRYIANFDTDYRLALGVDPADRGTVSADPVSRTGYYRLGTAVELSATPASGWTFQGFTGSINNPNSPLSLTMSKPHAITANFVPEGTGGGDGTNFVLTLESEPSHREVLIDGKTQFTPVTVSWLSGEHTIGVVRQQSGGVGARYSFLSWSNGGPQTQTFNVTRPGTQRLLARFRAEFQLEVSITPEGAGTFSLSPRPLDQERFFVEGTTVQIQALTEGNSVFAGFSGDITGFRNPQTIVMSQPRFVVANFTIPPP